MGFNAAKSLKNVKFGNLLVLIVVFIICLVSS